MFVQYNGVDLQVERVIGWSDRIVYSTDNTERLYRHVALAVQCIIHPQATTMPDVFPFPARGANQIVVDLKRRLLEPRKLLKVVIGPDVVLRSPAATARDDLPGAEAEDGVRTHYCDARGGPHPLYVDVVSIHGVKTMLATFAIETWLVDSSALEEFPREGVQTDENTFSALISHRWTQRNSIDTHFYNTRIIQGQAIFRADYLYELNATTGGLHQATTRPTDYLPYLNHPLPINYKRESVTTSVSSDGLTLDYTIVDQEQHSTPANNRPVARIGGTYRSGVAWGADSITGAIPMLPQYYVSLSVTAVGRRGATRKQLVDACLVAATTFDKNNGRLNARLHFTNEIMFTFGPEAPQATLSISYSATGLKAAIANGLNWAFSGDGAVIFDFPEILKGGLGNPISQEAQGPQPFLGMIGSGPPNAVSGQRRLNTQQILDGQYVPPVPPIATTPQDVKRTSDARDAQEARGDADETA